MSDQTNAPEVALVRKLLLTFLVSLLFVLQWQLWFGDNSVTKKAQIEELLTIKQIENEELEKRNKQIAQEIMGLKIGRQLIEEKAREELGMIRSGETFFFVSELQDQESSNER